MTRAIFAVLICVVLTTTGCGGAASLASWQKSVERYVEQTGGDDPTVLRDVKLPDGRRGFSTLGAPNPRESTDANGVLIGHLPINGTPRFVYLVGIVDRQAVKDIRLATLAIVNGRYDWDVGNKDADAVKQYLQQSERKSFPQPADRFELSLTDQSIIATHQQSGARWELAQ